MHEKHEAKLCIKQFVIFIKKQTRKSVKCLWLDQSQEFGVRELESWTKEKKIKMELTMTYSFEMNGIVECTNGLVTSKASCLLFNILSKIGQSFWPEVFITSIYLLNCSPLSFLKYDCPLAVWLRVYNSSNKSYTPDLDYLRTFGCQIFTKIPDEKQVKSEKTAFVGAREG